MKTKLLFTIIAALLFNKVCFSQPYNVVTDGGGDATTNSITKWKAGGSYKIMNSLLFDDGTYLGLGTTSPICKFHLFGTDYATSRVIFDQSGTTGFGASFDLRGIDSDNNNVATDVAIGTINTSASKFNKN
ncbi:MAG: hypothetical protein HY738_23600 [Bacteroidia bacterium]|nr:hypothetical protein [Bacteroidia bacterium]